MSSSSRDSTILSAHPADVGRLLKRGKMIKDRIGAHSGEVGRLFRMIPATDSGGKRLGIGAKRRWLFYRSQIMVFKSNGFSFFAYGILGISNISTT